SVDQVDAAVRDGLGLRWAVLGPFGCAQTNADTGIREYLTRQRASHTRITAKLGPTPSFDDEQIERLARGADSMLGRASLAEVRDWRDRMIRKIVELKRLDPEP